MPPTPKGPKRPSSTTSGAEPASSPSRPPAGAQAQPAPRRGVPLSGIPPVVSSPSASGDVSLGVAVSADAGGGTVTARKAGGLRDMAMEVDPDTVGVKAALQHLAKAVNIAFQTDYGENYLEAVYQAAIVRNNEIHIIHREYFGFGQTGSARSGCSSARCN